MKSWRALATAEAIKVRRAAPAALALAAPLLLFVFELLTLFARRTINQANPARLWNDFLGFSWVMWLGLFAPALVVFLAISMVGQEHGGRQWKQLFCYPVPRWRLFAIKMLFCGLLLAVSFLLFAITSVVGVLMFSGARGLGLAATTPWADVLLTTLQAYLASWLLIVVHIWLSVRFRGFAVPAGIAFAAILFGFLLLNVSREAFGWWYPWTLPLNVRPNGLYSPGASFAPWLFGSVAALALAPVASWDLGRRVKDV